MSMILLLLNGFALFKKLQKPGLKTADRVFIYG
jgi:hypothetical protein